MRDPLVHWMHLKTQVTVYKKNNVDWKHLQTTKLPNLPSILCFVEGDTAEGIFVDVCSHFQCQPCGVAFKTEPGIWSGVYCLGGMIPGDEIQLTHSYKKLSFCGVEVFGKTTGMRNERNDFLV